MLTHYANCRADYPEKPTGEAPRHLTSMEIGDGEIVVTCTDCGASVVQQDPNAAPVSVSKPILTRQLLITCPLAGSPALDYLRDDVQEFLESQWFDPGYVTVEIVHQEDHP